MHDKYTKTKKKAGKRIILYNVYIQLKEYNGWMKEFIDFISNNSILTTNKLLLWC